MKNNWLKVLDLLEYSTPQTIIYRVNLFLGVTPTKLVMHNSHVINRIGLCSIIQYVLCNEISKSDQVDMLTLLKNYNNKVTKHTYHANDLFFFEPIRYNSSSKDSCIVDRIEFVKSLIKYYYD